jgi:hypothetical protein
MILTYLVLQGTYLTVALGKENPGIDANLWLRGSLLGSASGSLKVVDRLAALACCPHSQTRTHRRVPTRVQKTNSVRPTYNIRRFNVAV